MNSYEEYIRQFAERPIPNFYKLVNAPVKIDKILAGGEAIVLEEGMTLSAAEVPGHSRGLRRIAWIMGKKKCFLRGIPFLQKAICLYLRIALRAKRRWKR